MLRSATLLFAALAPLASASTHTLGALQSLSCSAVCTLNVSVDSSSATVPLQLQFYGPSTVRWWLAIDGNFSDIGAAQDVIVMPPQQVTITSTPSGAAYILTPNPNPSNISVRLTKSPVTMSILVDGEVVVTETAPLSWNEASSWQTLARDATAFPSGLSMEHFFGGGMQNGRFAHRDQEITIAVDYNWDDGGHPNSVPLYISSAGYAVLRNTWAPGNYFFSSPVVTTHNESNRFDAFFFVAGPGPSSIKNLLGLYTELTGPPYMPPIYAFGLGDSDCYHNSRHGNSSRVAIAVAQEYRDNDMPGGWMLVNDGYGCGYGEPEDGPFPFNLTDLTYIIAELHDRGFYTGLWTSTGVPDIAGEVGVAGSRIAKTDVGWIGDGYKFAFDGVSLCANSIEQYSKEQARRFVWTVEGWAGTHRLATMWSGDDSGSMDYVRWQIPSFTGAGLSAQAHTSGDIDGIFGGSPESYVRDLQWKALTTTIMTMSGWAANPDKQPWTYGEPYTSYNRAALKLKSRLTPYVYSLSRTAFETGVPPMRAPLLEFPSDEALYLPSNASSYVFMTGEWLLAAPVYTAGALTRDDIYLPAGTQWVDWWNGTIWEGNQTLSGYSAPLDRLPLLVRAGAIIPMVSARNFFNEKPADPMYLELWPAGNTSFTLYEDDGVTRAALPPSAEFAKTLLSVSAPPNYMSASTSGNVTITVGAVAGSFAGQLPSRGWWLNVRCHDGPLLVLLTTGDSGAPLALSAAGSESELEALPSGFYFDDSLQGGLLMVKTPALAAAAGFSLVLSNGPSYARIGTETCDTPAHHQVEDQRFAMDAATGRITTVADASQCITVSQRNDPDSHTPAIEVQPCAPELDGVQRFVALASGQLALKADPTSCLDQDVSVNRVIEYGCHTPAGNQAWTLDSTTQHIVSVENGLCMCVLSA